LKYGCDANDEWESGGTIHHCLMNGREKEPELLSLFCA